MFSVLKKLVGSDQAPGRDKNIPAGLQSMNQALQRRFAKGVQYNMKIVIRGDRNTGKTTLWHRLQGKKFVEEYIPTQEIQVTSIHWNYKTTDDIVKVEVWDVVDKGKCKKRGDGLKLENDPQEAESEMALDAEFLDVYKNCNGVVMMFDITKQWTFNYILRELPKVPTHVPVCVLGNYRDMGEHRVILPDDVREFIDNLNRPPGSSYFRYAESSMKNSFGLKYLHKFFNIPFLQLQRETLLRQLETNQLDIDATLEELSVQQETEDQNYEIFLEMMEARNRGHASPLTANGQSPSSGSQSPIVPPSTTSTGSSSPSTPQPTPQQLLANSATCPSLPPSVSPVPPSEAQTQATSPPIVATSPGPPTPAPPQPQAQRRSIISRLFGTSPASEAIPSPPEPTHSVEAPAKVQSVEDFIPEDSLDRSFLEDTNLKDEKKIRTKVEHESDSDGDATGGNPMVAGFQDDLDLEDKPSCKTSLAADPIPSRNIALSSEDEADEVSACPQITSLSTQKNLEPETKWSSRNSLKPQSEAVSTKATDSKLQVSLPTRSGSEKCSGTKPTSETLLGNEAPSQEEFPVREDLSDVTDEDMPPAKLPQPIKPTVHSFKMKNDSDLFGLGLEEPGPKESSDEDKEGKLTSKEKKKKKKKSKEEEEKTAKKKSKHKKAKDKEEGKDEKKRKKKRSKEKTEEIDELEAFLGGGAIAPKQHGGGDYEEL
ncbi:rab-like protein 6 isoform X6 [Sminthopsis crassicaudata]|uniref:rab-like protein 6 isoform X6 n=1 Tax=Sminthopsis crassicaudata TaxID=9301 RepID=UPI003D681FEB